MSYAYGFIDLKGNELPKERVNTFTELHNFEIADKILHLQKDDCFFGCELIYNTQESLTEVLPYESDEIIITADARIDNREELIEIFNLDTLDICDSQLILLSYKKWGESFPKHLRGAFFICIHDINLKKTFLVRDQLGMKGGVYTNNPVDNIFCFSSSLAPLIKFQPKSVKINDYWVKEYLSGIPARKGNTAYTAFSKLEAGELVEIGDKGIFKKQYYNFDYKTELKFDSFEDCIAFFKKELERSIKELSRSVYNLGSELSGGLDSSTVVGYLHEILTPEQKNNFHAYANCAQEAYYELRPNSDERKYRDELVDFFKIKNFHAFTKYSKSLNNYEKSFLEINGSPAEMNASHSFKGTESLLSAKQNNVRTILTGIGGDEGISAKPEGGIVKKQLLKKLKFSGLAHELKKEGAGSWRWLHLPFAIWKIVIKDEKSKSSLAKSFRRRFQLIRNSFISLEEYHEQASSFSEMSDSSDLKQFHKVAFQRGFLAARMSASDLYGKSYGVEYRHPLMDLKIIEAYLSLDYNNKIHPTITRPILRGIGKQVLPELVAQREGKSGSVYPSWFFERKGGLMDELEKIKELNLTKNLIQIVDVHKVDEIIHSYSEPVFLKNKELRVAIRDVFWIYNWNEYIRKL